MCLVGISSTCSTYDSRSKGMIELKVNSAYQDELISWAIEMEDEYQPGPSLNVWVPDQISEIRTCHKMLIVAEKRWDFNWDLSSVLVSVHGGGVGGVEGRAWWEVYHTPPTPAFPFLALPFCPHPCQNCHCLSVWFINTILIIFPSKLLHQGDWTIILSPPPSFVSLSGSGIRAMLVS